MTQTQIDLLRAERDNLKDRVSRLEREWTEDHRVIELLRAAGFITEEKVQQARELASSLR